MHRCVRAAGRWATRPTAVLETAACDMACDDRRRVGTKAKDKNAEELSARVVFTVDECLAKKAHRWYSQTAP